MKKFLRFLKMTGLSLAVISAVAVPVMLYLTVVGGIVALVVWVAVSVLRAMGVIG